MESTSKSRVSYRAAVSLFFILAAIVIALAGLLPSKSSIAAAEQADKKATAEALLKSRQHVGLTLEDWVRIAKSE